MKPEQRGKEQLRKPCESRIHNQLEIVSKKGHQEPGDVMWLGPLQAVPKGPMCKGWQHTAFTSHCYHGGLCCPVPTLSIPQHHSASPGRPLALGLKLPWAVQQQEPRISTLHLSDAELLLHPTESPSLAVLESQARPLEAKGGILLPVRYGSQA